MNRKEDINELLARHFANEKMTDGQQAELDSWISDNTEEYQRLRKLIGASLNKPDEECYDTEKAWQKIESKLHDRPSLFNLYGRTWKLVAAASLLLVILFSVPYLSGNTEGNTTHYANTDNTHKMITLPDGSEVQLYPHSTLAFSQSDGKEARVAKLKGKAFFKVKRQNGMSFKVETEAIDVEVLGTSFLVDAATKNNTGVYVSTGTVKVTAGETSVIIVKNEKAILKDGNLQTGTFDNADTTLSESDVTLTFSNTRITDVVKQIEQETGIRIELSEGLEQNLVTTRFDNIDARNMAEELAFICGCKYKTITEGKHYKLYK